MSVQIVEKLYSQLLPAEIAAAKATGLRDKQDVLRLVTHQFPESRARTGLSAAVPPQDIPMLGRTENAVGVFGTAQWCVNRLAESGLKFREGQTYLDFGCSSGSVLRILGPAFPQAKWLGVDPMSNAVEWAKANLDVAEFSVSSEKPPLHFDNRTIDGSFAISIWSHFSPKAAVAWFEELARITKAGGFLLFTTHGKKSAGVHLSKRRMKAERAEEINRRLREDGFCFFNPWGSETPHGISTSEWGMAYYRYDYLKAMIPRSWTVHSFIEAGLNGNQDSYVLVRT